LKPKLEWKYWDLDEEGHIEFEQNVLEVNIATIEGLYGRVINLPKELRLSFTRKDM